MDTPPGSPDTPETAAPNTEGSSDAFAHLTPLVHQQLRHLEQRYLQRELRGDTDQSVNRALANRSTSHGVMTGRTIGNRLIDQKHFFAVCARQMRRILVDHANIQRRDTGLPETGGDFDVLELDQLLSQLEQLEPNASLSFELYYFGGHNTKELATITRVSEVTVQRQLRFARAWLLAQAQQSAC